MWDDFSDNGLCVYVVGVRVKQSVSVSLSSLDYHYSTASKYFYCHTSDSRLGHSVRIFSDELAFHLVLTRFTFMNK